MTIAEGVSARLAYKFYPDGIINANSEPDIAVLPGKAGGQILRRVSSGLKFGKDTYQSGEVRSDKQIADFRHGTRRVSGSGVSGELSPLTYADFFEAAFRGTWEAELTLTELQLTSVAADKDDGTLTFGGGDPVALGLRVGHIGQLTNASDIDNNAKNFVITGFSGPNNRTVHVFPPPDDMVADTDFELVTVGKRLAVPSSGHVSRKCAVEVYNEDIDVARLYTETRVSGFTLQLPASGMSTIEFPMMGRNMHLLQDGVAPYFDAPAAETETGIFAAVNGLIQVNGVAVGVITGINVQLDMSPSADPVVGQNVVPEIFLGRANVTGQITAFFQDGTLINAFVDEDEISLLVYLTTESAPNSPAFTLYLPRIKLSDADTQTSGEGGQSITLPFQGLKSSGAPGVDATTIQIVDTAVT